MANTEQLDQVQSRTPCPHCGVGVTSSLDYLQHIKDFHRGAYYRLRKAGEYFDTNQMEMRSLPNWFMEKE